MLIRCTTQGLFIRSKVLTRGQSIEPADVALLSIYDSSYCIHADGLTGKVSLRNVTNLEQGTPEHDIVIDVSEQDVPVGPLRLSVVDNLFVVHCLERTARNRGCGVQPRSRFELLWDLKQGFFPLRSCCFPTKRWCFS